MKTNAESIKFVRTLQATPEMVLGAFVQPAELRQWLCDTAQVQPRAGGRLDLGWASGYEAHGRLTAYRPPLRLALTWLGSGDPGETAVTIALKPAGDGTRLTLTHTGFGTGKKWAGRAQEAERAWSAALDNLQSVLETGLDLREAHKPRIGLGIETAKDGQGAIVTEIAPGAPAEQAGLQQGDVIVRVDGRAVRSQDDFMAIFQASRAGQRLKIAYVRDGQRRATTVTLGARPVPVLSPEDAVEQARQIHEQALATLRVLVAGLSDEQAGQAPAAGEWSVKQTLAHLSACEPGFQSWAVDTLLGQESRWVEARLPEQLAAVLHTTPTVGHLMERLEQDMAESRALVTALTPEHRAYKGRCRQVALTLLAFAGHIDMHIQQIQATLRVVGAA